MNKLVEKLITNIICTTFFILYIQELNWVQNNSILLDSIVNLKKKKKKKIQQKAVLVNSAKSLEILRNTLTIFLLFSSRSSRLVRNLL
jgi:hypothetical protein